LQQAAAYSVRSHLAAIGWKHRQDGLVAPVQRDERMVIADTLAGIRRETRARPSARKVAITAKDLAAMIAAADGEGTRSSGAMSSWLTRA